MHNELYIISLNCRSIYSRLSELKLLVYKEEPHIVCLSETWAVQNRIPSFINYRSHWKHRIGSRGGGLAILVRSDIVTIPKLLTEITSGLEVQTVTILMENYKIDLLNIYNAERNTNMNTFLHYFQQLSRKFIIVGDFNAHHHIWSKMGTPSNITGNSLAAILGNRDDISLATPPQLTTYIDARTANESTLDLCFMSSNLMNPSIIDALPCVGSDHLPIRIKLNIKPIIQKSKIRPKWKLDGIDWFQWSSNLDRLEWDDQISLDIANSNLKNA